MPKNEPDLAVLLAASYGALTRRLLDGMKAAGLRDMRPRYGFVIRAVAAEQPTIKRLAELLAVTKQAASKLADEMERAGFLARVADEGDARAIRLHLSRKGQRVFQCALGTSRDIEEELKRSVGARDVAALRRALIAFLEQSGDLDDVLARRAKASWS